MLISVKIIPNAKITEAVGYEGKTLKVRVAAPPIDGRANKELIKLMANLCGCAPSEIEVIKGQTTKLKLLDVPVLPEI